MSWGVGLTFCIESRRYDGVSYLAVCHPVSVFKSAEYFPSFALVEQHRSCSRQALYLCQSDLGRFSLVTKWKHSQSECLHAKWEVVSKRKNLSSISVDASWRNLGQKRASLNGSSVIIRRRPQLNAWNQAPSNPLVNVAFSSTYSNNV